MCYINVKGKISHLGEIESKTTRNGGTWEKQWIVILIPGPRNTYHEIAFLAQGNTRPLLDNFSEGDEVEVSGYISAREYNGRYYNDVELSSIVPVGNLPKRDNEPTATEKPKTKKDEDLPF